MHVAIAAVVSTPDDAAFVAEAERLGATSVWVPEAWGQDALTPLAYLAARTTTIRLGSGIVQLGARTPAMLAMSAMSMQSLSDGRFLLGLGTSGPQVMEGWHGVRFRAPVAATRETIEIVRAVPAATGSSYDGTVYQLPLPDGPGRALRSMMPPTEVPDLRRRARPAQPRAHRRAGRRLDRQRLPSRARRCVPRPPRRGRGAGGPIAGRPRPADPRGGRVHRRRRRGGQATRPGLRLHHRRHGLEGHELLQRRLHPPGLRRRRRRRAGPLARRPSRRSRRPRADRARPQDQPARPAGDRQGPATPATAMPASPRSRPSSTAIVSHRLDTLAQLIDLVDETNREADADPIL